MTTRRNFLVGAAAVPVAAAVPAFADHSEFDALIAAHAAALVEEDRRLDAFNELERRMFATAESRNDPALEAEYHRLNAWVSEAGEAELDALWDICEFAPRTMQEVRRRSDYLLANAPQLEDVGGDFFVVFVASLSSVGAAAG